jgi:hypothetical protein
MLEPLHSKMQRIPMPSAGVSDDNLDFLTFVEKLGVCDNLISLRTFQDIVSNSFLCGFVKPQFSLSHYF